MQSLVGKSSNLDIDLITDEIQEWADRIAAIHGKAMITNEANGIHIYFPSPYLVEEEGEVEVYRGYPHGAVNIEKYLALGRYARTRKKYGGNCCQCMKTQRAIDMKKLMEYAPVEQRIGRNVKRQVTNTVKLKENALISDGKGNKIPRHPGVTVSVLDLDKDHPAIQYLHSRGFYNLQKLYDFCRLSFCEQEEPANRENGIYYKKLANGFADTPQGRLIFYGDVHGVQNIWQARILDIPDLLTKGRKAFWHPYEKTWVDMEFKNHETGKWEALYPQLKWAKQYSKYRTATGSQRNRTCLGLDAAVRWNMKNNRDLNKVCVLCEGPLDAARLGAPAIAMLGKTISHEQAKLILNNFDKVAYVADKDEAGERGRDSFLQRFASQIPVKLVDLPDGFKDAGDLSEKQALGVMVREVYTWK